MTGLPTFRKVTLNKAARFAQQVFGDKLATVIAKENDSYRAVFAVNYFTLQPDADAPSKSQWNTLKKRMKRVNKGVFVFKAHGDTTHEGTPRYYVDFGFLTD
jgi:vancomycin permeability regulator SanA